MRKGKGHTHKLGPVDLLRRASRHKLASCVVLTHTADNYEPSFIFNERLDL